MPGVPAGMMNVPNQANQFPGQMPAVAPQQMPHVSKIGILMNCYFFFFLNSFCRNPTRKCFCFQGSSPSQFPSPGGSLEGPMGRLTVQVRGISQAFLHFQVLYNVHSHGNYCEQNCFIASDRFTLFFSRVGFAIFHGY